MTATSSADPLPSSLTPPEAICFDAFDTLILLDQPAQRLHAALAKRGVDVAPATAAEAFVAEVTVYKRTALLGCDERGLAAVRRAAVQAMTRVLERHGTLTLDLDEREAVLLESLSFRLAEGAHDALAAVEACGLPMAVVSNWDCSLLDVLERFDLRGRFAAVAISAVVGVEKPHPGLWQPALAALGSRPNRTWHIGDDPMADGLGARAAGLVPLLVGEAEAPPGVHQLGAVSALPALLAAVMG